jgi:anti-anti-sigma regulatory factor
MKYNPCTILQCEPTEVPGCWYILAEGHLDLGPPLDAFTARVREAIIDGARWMIFDARTIKTYVDCGHGAMVSLSDSLQQAGGGAIMLQMDARNRMIFKMLTIEHFFHFAESMEQALAIAGGSGEPAR